MAKSDENVTVLSQLFRILGDETRLRILIELQEGPRNVSELCKRLKTPQPTVSHHLSILRMGEVVTSQRNGKEIFYSVNALEKHKYGKAFTSLLKQAAAIRLGKVVVGMVS
ncbi:MAG: winged helix-turn-helix transcriptional regulator [Planctomycetes bacterium]|jgi:DNA-binding transcriptional ArsR family regulator|nr:winged helix-turn-helix transcriptional regulator [Planctomycetota bacterium]